LSGLESSIGSESEYFNNESCYTTSEVDTKKKTMVASERKEEEREQWRNQAKDLDPEKMVFVDETASNTALARVYGRAPKGKRANGKIPRNKGKNVTVIASLSPSGMGESLLLEDAANGEMFTLYLEKVLMPSLHPGQIVIMDNASIHEGEKVRQAIEAKGCHVLFLPPYSPDFSPIEEAFSKFKALLRKKGARTREDLQEAITQALTEITPADARGWFRHCGYLLPDDADELQVG
jgi:transposase